jgi:hypothetical protein
MHKLLGRIESEFRPVESDPRRGCQLWPNVWVDGLFVKAHYKFHRVCWDALHAAALLERTVRAAGGVILSSSADSGRRMDAIATVTKDATIYLDVLMFYFRIHADCLAALVPNLYGTAGQRISKKARDSFRQHRRWFQKNREFDPTYADIVRDGTSWFDILSGEDAGWRDDLVHRFGTWQIALRIGSTAELLAGIDRPVHPDYPNLLDEFRRAVSEYCAFLDAATSHFARRINSETRETVFDLAQSRQWGCGFVQGGSPGLWILPTLAD